MGGTSRQARRLILPTLLGTVLVLVLWPKVLDASPESDDDSHWRGQAVFKQKGCAECHSIFGGEDKAGPDLSQQKFYGTYLELAARMWNHFPKMYDKMQKEDVEFRDISAEEMGQLIKYLSFIRYRGKPGNAYKGQKVLKKSCMPCHKYGGKGGDIGPAFDRTTEYESSIQFIESMWNHGSEMMDVFFEHQIRRPVFKGDDVANLLAAMRTYISTTKVPAGTFAMGDPQKGKALFDSRGCVQCHSYRGEGGDLGPDFDDIDLDKSAVEIAGKMWNHGPKMWKVMKEENIAVPVFEKGELAHVLAYIYALKLEDDPGDPAKGHRAVSDKGCLNCHALQGQGADVSVDLATIKNLNSPLAMIADMWNHAATMRETQLDEDLKWPKLSARDMANIYAYLFEITRASDQADDQEQR